MSSQPETTVLWEQKLAENPRSLVFSRLADSYRKKGDVQRAIDICVEGLRNNPDHVTARIILARCYLEQEDFRRAIEEFRTVCRYDRHNHIAIKMLADVFAKQGMEEKAGDLYAVLFKMDPENPSLAHLTRVYQSTGQADLFGIIGVAAEAEEQPAAKAETAPAGPKEEQDREDIDLSELGISEEGEEQTEQAPAAGEAAVSSEEVEERMDALFEGDGETRTPAAQQSGPEEPAGEPEIDIAGEPDGDETPTVGTDAISSTDVSSRLEEMFGEEGEDDGAAEMVSSAEEVMDRVEELGIPADEEVSEGVEQPPEGVGTETVETSTEEISDIVPEDEDGETADGGAVSGADVSSRLDEMFGEEDGQEEGDTEPKETVRPEDRTEVDVTPATGSAAGLGGFDDSEMTVELDAESGGDDRSLEQITDDTTETGAEEIAANRSPGTGHTEELDTGVSEATRDREALPESNAGIDSADVSARLDEMFGEGTGEEGEAALEEMVPAEDRTEVDEPPATGTGVGLEDLDASAMTVEIDAEQESPAGQAEDDSDATGVDRIPEEADLDSVQTEELDTGAAEATRELEASPESSAGIDGADVSARLDEMFGSEEEKGESPETQEDVSGRLTGMEQDAEQPARPPASSEQHPGPETAEEEEPPVDLWDTSGTVDTTDLDFDAPTRDFGAPAPMADETAEAAAGGEDHEEQRGEVTVDDNLAFEVGEPVLDEVPGPTGQTDETSEDDVEELADTVMSGEAAETDAPADNEVNLADAMVSDETIVLDRSMIDAAKSEPEDESAETVTGEDVTSRLDEMFGESNEMEDLDEALSSAVADDEADEEQPSGGFYNVAGEAASDEAVTDETAPEEMVLPEAPLETAEVSDTLLDAPTEETPLPVTNESRSAEEEVAQDVRPPDDGGQALDEMFGPEDEAMPSEAPDEAVTEEEVDFSPVDELEAETDESASASGVGAGGIDEDDPDAPTIDETIPDTPTEETEAPPVAGVGRESAETDEGDEEHTLDELDIPDIEEGSEEAEEVLDSIPDDGPETTEVSGDFYTVTGSTASPDGVDTEVPEELAIVPEAEADESSREVRGEDETLAEVPTAEGEDTDRPPANTEISSLQEDESLTEGPPREEDEAAAVGTIEEAAVPGEEPGDLPDDVPVPADGDVDTGTPADTPTVEQAAGMAAIPDHVLTPTLADIYFQQGQPGVALEIYRRIQKADPDNERIARRMEEVRAAMAEDDGARAPEAATESSTPSRRPSSLTEKAGGRRKRRSSRDDRPLKGVRIKKKVRERISRRKRKG